MDEVVAHGVGRSLAEDRPAGVARDEPGEGEHDEDDPEQDRDRDEEPTEDELDHRWSVTAPVMLVMGSDGGAAGAAPPFEHRTRSGSAQEAGGLRKPPHRPGKYSKAPVRPLCSGCCGIPLDRVAEDDVVGVEVGAVVELDAVTQRAGPGGGVGVGGALGGEGRDGRGAADLVARTATRCSARTRGGSRRPSRPRSTG